MIRTVYDEKAKVYRVNFPDKEKELTFEDKYEMIKIIFKKFLEDNPNIIKKKDSIVIKPNFGDLPSPQKIREYKTEGRNFSREMIANWSNVELIEALIKLLKDKGFNKITIAEGTTCQMPDTSLFFEINRMEELTKKYNVELVDLRKDKFVHQKHDGKLKETLIAKTILNADVLINLAVMKSREPYEMSMCMKNLMGVTDIPTRHHIHDGNLLEKIPELVKKVRPTINIIEGEVGALEFEGYIQRENPELYKNKKMRFNVLFLSTDPVAIDGHALKLLGKEPEKAMQIKHAEEIGLGSYNDSEIVTLEMGEYQNVKIKVGDILLTMACPVECNFCIFVSSKNGEWMSEETIKKAVKEFKESNIPNVRIMGGEPFYNLNKLKTCLQIIEKEYPRDKISTITSGFFATSIKKTRHYLKGVKGLKEVEVSFDRFHQEKVSISNIENILKVAQDLNIKILLRIMIDSKSKHLIDEIIRLINFYKCDYSFHQLDFKGKAESLDGKLNDEFYDIRKIILSKIEKRKDIIIKSSKIEDEKIRLGTLSVHPDGSVYSCCDGEKLSYLGNIKNTKLKTMLERALESLPVFLQQLGCKTFRYLPPNTKSRCDLCKNLPLVEEGNWGKSYVGSKYVKVNLKNLNKIKEKYDKKHRLLLSINIKKDELNRNTGKKIIQVLEKIQNNGQGFKISKPLPRCIFGYEFKNIKNRFNIPSNCFECNELFDVDSKGQIKFCSVIKNNPDIKFKDMENRKDIYAHFEKLTKNISPNETCKNCLFFKRGGCVIYCINAQ